MKTFSEEDGEQLRLLSGIAPLEFQPAIPPDAVEMPLFSESFDAQIVVQTIHGGDVVDPDYYRALLNLYSEQEREEKLLRGYCIEKDWGANQVAAKLAGYLGLKGYWKVNVARIVMDFGRFPGVTRPGASYQGRFAVNYPFSYALDYEGKKSVLEKCYDPISSQLERAAEGKLICLAVHTYDPFNPGAHYLEPGTPRPEVSLLYRSATYQEHKRMPFGIFDPMYPDILMESTADQRLVSRVGLTLQKAGVALVSNYPYLMPDGCMEIRSQVFFFFVYLRNKFQEAFPESGEDPAYQAVWNMLFDTDLRSSASEALRSYIHMFRKAPDGYEPLFSQARQSYEHISNFLRGHRAAVVRGFLDTATRFSTLGIEVRKDLVWQFQDAGATQPVFGPGGARWKNIDAVARLLAEGMIRFLKEDRLDMANGFNGFWRQE